MTTQRNPTPPPAVDVEHEMVDWYMADPERVKTYRRLHREGEWGEYVAIMGRAVAEVMQQLTASGQERRSAFRQAVRICIMETEE